MLRIFIPLLAVLFGGWFADDGMRAFTKGDNTTSSSEPYAGQLGPWQHGVENKLSGEDRSVNPRDYTKRFNKEVSVVRAESLFDRGLGSTRHYESQAGQVSVQIKPFGRGRRCVELLPG